MPRIISAATVALGVLASVLISQQYPTHSSSSSRIRISPCIRLSIQPLTKWILFTWQTSSITRVFGDEDDDFLKEILAEEQREAEELAKLEAEMRELDALKAQHAEMHRNKQKMKPGGGGGSNNMNKPGGANKNSQFQQAEEQLRKKEAETAEAKRMKNAKAVEDLEKKKAKELAAKREAEYRAELERLKDDEDAKKALQRQKQRDTKIVRKIIRQSDKGWHYSVLGMKCKWGEIKIGPIRICNVSQGDIKRAYRTVAKVIHPDKNRDGRAPEAFRALEKSAELLMDDKKKKEYDAILKRQRKEMMDGLVVGFKNAMRTAYKIFKLLGPFATPITILVALVI